MVTGTGNLTLKNITLTNGRVQAGNGGGFGQGFSPSGGGGAAGLGGAIFNAGTLQLVQSTLTGNAAIGGNGGAGGAVSNDAFGGAGGGGFGGNGGGGYRGGGGGGGTTGNGGNSAMYNGGNGGTGGSGGTNGSSVRPPYAGGVATGAGGGGGSFAANGGSGGVGGGGGGGGFSFGPGYAAGASTFGGGGGGGGSGPAPSGPGGSGGFGGGGGGSGSGSTLAGGAAGYGAGTGGSGGGPYHVGAAGGGGGGGGGAGMGGAIFNSGGTLVVTNSTIAGNTAQGGAGGLANNGGGLGGNGTAGKGVGGGIFNRNGTATILNCTIDGNTAAQGGGGILTLGDGAGNTAMVTMNNTIVADSTAAVSDFASVLNGGSTNNSGGNNVIPNTGPFFTGTITTSPQLSALASNGGPTQTMALAPASPAVNAAIGGLAPATDQRGFSRASAADIGAFELGGVNAVTVSPATLPAAQVGVAYSQSIAASGGTAPNTFTVTAGALPAGLTLSAAGMLSGTPTVSGSFSFTVKATDSSGGAGPFSGIQAYTFTVNPAAIPAAPIITSQPFATPSPATAGQSVQFTAAASGGSVLTFTWNFADGASATGSTVSHTFVAAGTYTVSLKVVDAFGQSISASVAVSVAAVVLDPNGDANGDGYPNEVALALGSNPSLAGVTPLGAPAITSSGVAAVKKLKINLKFAQQNGDQIQIMGSLPGVSSVAAGSVLIFDIGHVVNGFTINKTGKSIGSAGLNGRLNDSCQIRSTTRGGATFTAKLMAGAYQTALASESDPLFQLTPAQGASKTRTVNVTVYLNSVAYKAQVTSVYVARKGQFGK